jgi:hypothetical protein
VTADFGFDAGLPGAAPRRERAHRFVPQARRPSAFSALH